ncbi:putative pentatricopeptide repeat-containing protein At5g37570 [Bidens hawaiensis]|uniref:putative pentatricopeptide repeat-containing protein At5g37570 n=1 Tax=Bidens hawaiensis TaxID=980011 RepID=UPI004049C7BD
MILFVKMLSSNVRPNNMTFPFVIKACRVLARTEFGCSVHSYVLKCGFESDVYVQSSLIKFYADAKWLCYARRVFDEMPCRDVVCWNSMIDACVKCGGMELARKVFDEMPRRDVVSWNSMINGYGVVGCVGDAKKLFDEMPERNVVSWNSMLAGYVKCGNVEDAANMFRDMPNRDVVSWNAMLACYVQNGESNETLALFDEMKAAGVRVNEATVVSVLSAVGQLGGLDQGVQLHMYINENGIKINPIVATALIDMYVKCGNIEEALKVFNSMQTKDILAWNTMLIGMGMHGHVNDAQQLFKQMQLEGVVSNDITFVAMFGAFRHAGMTEEGQKLLSSMKDVFGVEPKIEHYGCVIDLLARAGRLNEALDLIKSMPFEPNEYAYGALLGGCKIHGNDKVAQLVGKHLLDLDPHHSGRYISLSNIYAGAKRWDDARTTRKLMQDNGVAKVPGVSVVEFKEDVVTGVLSNIK